MNQLRLTVPAMWADHHVLVVRKTLAETSGVTAVEASARDFSLLVSFDPQAVTAQDIVATLGEAGYAEGAAPGPGDPQAFKPAWAAGGLRATTTNPADAAMSGDYRKY